MGELEDTEREEAQRRRRKERTRKKRKNSARHRKYSNVMYEVKWALAALAFGLPILATIFYLMG